MTLEPGDRIDTGPRAYVVVRYPAGTELLVSPNSSGRIGGSLTDFSGKVFVKVHGAFEVETAFVKAGARDAAYLLRTYANGTTAVTVLAGSVDVGSTANAWPSLTIDAGGTTLAHPQAPRPLAVSAAELAQTRDSIERIERLAPIHAKAAAVAPAPAAPVREYRGDPPTIVSPTVRPPPQPAPHQCAAAGLAPFPWPTPPQPTITAIVPPYLLFGTESKTATLAAVAARLEGAIERAGYKEPKYLGAGCNGFAIVLDLEHISADGTRIRGAAGFAPPSQEEAFSLAGYIKRLFYAPPGHYRQIVLLVSDQRMANATAPATEAQLREISKDGVSALPGAFSELQYTSQDVVQALIYEFEKGPRDGDATLSPPEGRLGATVHLQKAQLF
jgi:hypothetical protein